MSAPPTRRPGAAWTLFLLLAGGLLLGRLAIRILLERVMRELPLDTTLHREAEHIWLLTLHAVTAAGIALSLLSWRARSKEARGAPRGLKDFLTVAIAAALCVSVLAGWPVAVDTLVPQWNTPRGRSSLQGMGALSLFTTAMFLFALRGEGAAAPAHRVLGRRGARVAALLLLLLPPLGLLFANRHLSSRAIGREVVRELAFETGTWRPLEQHPRIAPKADVLCPVPDWRYDGGDLPALLMPPPCRVEFEVRPEDGEVFLRAAAGVDHLGYERMPPQDPAITVRFEVRVNGQSVFEHETDVQYEGDAADRVWRRVGGERGIALSPGDQVELATSVISPIYDKPGAVPGIPAGFGGVVLEREWKKKRSSSSPETPNVVLIVMDTLRQDRLSCYGHPEQTSPNIDALAERGILFENANATASWTWPSTASLLTGLVPEAHGVEADESCYLRSQFESLPELLGARKFATGAFSCNPLIVPDKGFAQGFEDFDSLHGFRRSETMIQAPLDWLELHASHRFFLYVHLVDTHAPYVPIDEFLDPIRAQKPADFPEGGINEYHPRLLRGEGRDAEGRPIPDAVIPAEHLRWLNTVYDGSVRTADHFVGLVLDKLEELGLDDRTIVAFTSDHGEELLDHGLVTHGSTMYRELVRAPLIIAGPGLPQGRRVSTPVSNRHLAPTLAKFGNARFSSIPDPIDLTRIDEIPQLPVYFSTHQGWWNGNHRLVIHGVRDGDWVLHWAPEGAPWGAAQGDSPTGGVRLYHLAEDPWQQRDVAAEEPERATRLLSKLRQHLDDARRDGSQVILGAGSQSRNLLEGIGYIQSDEDEPKSSH